MLGLSCRIYLFLLLMAAATEIAAQTTTSLVGNPRNIDELKIGFNRRSDRPIFWTDATFQSLIEDINPDIVRYPAGTQANYWDWSTGQFLENTDKNWNNREVVTIPTFINGLPLNTDIIYVVNLARPTPASGVSVNASEAVLKSNATLQAKIQDMLAAIATFDQNGKLPYAVELGNEFYFGNIESGIFEIIEQNGQFFSGWNPVTNSPYVSASKALATEVTARFYLEQAAQVAAAIKAQYPDMKIALCTTKGGNNFRDSWNNTIFTELASNPTYASFAGSVDAVTQHHYINDNYGSSTAVFDDPSSQAAIAEGISYPIDKQVDYNMVPAPYELWLTEYGATKPNADETWATGLRSAALTLSWLQQGDKVMQLEYHHITDENVIVEAAPRKLAPIGLAFKYWQMAAKDMDALQFLSFTNSPQVISNIEALHGIKFSSATQQKVLLLNLSDTAITNLDLTSVFSGNTMSQIEQISSTTPWQSPVFDSHSSLIQSSFTTSSPVNLPEYSITVVARNIPLSTDRQEVFEVAIYPNPARVTVSISSDSTIKDLKLIDLNGRVVKEIEGIQATDAEINLNGLTSGIYLLKITSTNGASQIKKLIVNYEL